MSNEEKLAKQLDELVIDSRNVLSCIRGIRPENLGNFMFALDREIASSIRLLRESYEPKSVPAEELE